MCYKIQGIPQKCWVAGPFPAGSTPSSSLRGVWVGDHEGRAAADGCSLLLSQAISISKAINTQEAPVKEKHARRILSLGLPGRRKGDPVRQQEGFHPLELEPRVVWGDRRPTQTLVGGWHRVGASISENANKSGAIKLHFFGNKMQRALV